MCVWGELGRCVFIVGVGRDWYILWGFWAWWLNH